LPSGTFEDAARPDVLCVPGGFGVIDAMEDGATLDWLRRAADDAWRDYGACTAQGVRFVRPPAEQPYGWVAVFEDLYGDRWDLIDPA
jgi:predicted enzyme related to lactoylglutathione lyase